jgi:hypothetical protein
MRRRAADRQVPRCQQALEGRTVAASARALPASVPDHHTARCWEAPRRRDDLLHLCLSTGPVALGRSRPRTGRVGGRVRATSGRRCPAPPTGHPQRCVTPRHGGSGRHRTVAAPTPFAHRGRHLEDRCLARGSARHALQCPTARRPPCHLRRGVEVRDGELPPHLGSPAAPGGVPTVALHPAGGRAAGAGRAGRRVLLRWRLAPRLRRAARRGQGRRRAGQDRQSGLTARPAARAAATRRCGAGRPWPLQRAAAQRHRRRTDAGGAPRQVRRSRHAVGRDGAGQDGDRQRGPGVDDYVRRGATAIVVPTGRPNALHDAMQWVLQHPDAARQIGESANATSRSASARNGSSIVASDSRTACCRPPRRRRRLVTGGHETRASSRVDGRKQPANGAARRRGKVRAASAHLSS